MDDYVQQYIASFGNPSSESGKYPKDSKLAKAYEVALDIRKFEIELYWKRSTSFWLLVGGIAAALGLLLSGKGDSSSETILSQRGKEISCFVLCLSGAIVCCAWKMVNDGSKFWQRNWEYQVSILEQEVLGPLYKTVMSSSKNKVMYSVSMINGIISFYLCCVFLVAALVLLIGKEGLSLLLDGLGNWIAPSWLSFIVKLLILRVHVWFYFKLKGAGQNRTDKNDFDSEIEVSVRKVSIERGPYGTCSAKKIWNAPVPYPDVSSNIALSPLQNLMRFIKKLFF